MAVGSYYPNKGFLQVSEKVVEPFLRKSWKSQQEQEQQQQQDECVPIAALQLIKIMSPKENEKMKKNEIYFDSIKISFWQ